MTLLEERYRLVLRLLPASYRAEWEDEMVATFMEAAGDVSDEDNPKPRWPEILSVAALAVRVRLGGVGASPRSLAWGEAVRLAALLGLLILAALGAVGALSFLRLYVVGPPPELGLDYSQVLGPAGSALRLWNVVGGLAGLAWIAAYVTLVRGHRRAAQVLAVVALAPRVYATGTALVLGPSFALAGALAPVLVVLALLTGFHRDAPHPMRRGRWLAALPVGVGALLAVSLAVPTLDPSFQSVMWTWLSPGGLYCVLLVAAGLVYLCVHAYAPVRRRPMWPLALALLTVPVLSARVAGVPFSLTAPGQGAATVVLGQIAAVTLLGLVLAALSARMLRPLPASPVHRRGTVPSERRQGGAA